MRRFLTGLGMVMMICLVCISCKKDDTNYPAELKGLWAGGNGSTGHSCNVLFTPTASAGLWCTISITNPTLTATDTFVGRYSYDQSSGIGTFSSDSDGAPAAEFRYNEEGTQLSANIKSSSVDYGTYTLTSTALPSSISGSWNGTAKGDESYSINAIFAPKAIIGGLPVTITVNTKPIATVLSGTYTYDETKGSAVIKLEDGGTATMTYNVNTNKLTGKVMTFDVEIERMPAE